MQILYIVLPKMNSIKIYGFISKTSDLISCGGRDAPQLIEGRRLGTKIPMNNYLV